MARISPNMFKDWKDGDIVFAGDYKQEREIIRTAINDNYDRIVDRYTKAEVDAFLQALDEGRLDPRYYTRQQIDNFINNLQTQVTKNTDDVATLFSTRYTKAEVDSFLNNKADKSNSYTRTEIDSKLSLKADRDKVYTKDEVYTKRELAPYLQGGDTKIIYEVYTIVSSNNGDGTFTYKDRDENEFLGELTEEGYQIFRLRKGFYETGMNRIEVTIDDTLHRSTASGGLLEIDQHHVALTMPEGNGTEVTIKYYQRIGITGEKSIIVNEVMPPDIESDMLWFKVIG